MKAIKIILAGIGFIVFGIACFLIAINTNWPIFNTPGFLFPIAGIIMIIYALIMKEEQL
jgi:4-hydroxybenzoate polyprenyltransferase